MKGKGVLGGVLLSMALCLVPGGAHGEVKEWMHEVEASVMELELLRAQVRYIMERPATFLNVVFYYDRDGRHGRELPGHPDMAAKIFVVVKDNRDAFSPETGRDLLDQFRKELEDVYSFVKIVATDMDADVAAKFYSKEGAPLGYFYRGRYRLWEEYARGALEEMRSNEEGL